MYNQSHLRRILPRKDEHCRTEFPSHYYSTSSVYSYSPTSSSDCPEHGRSHRKAKIMLTLCVIFATLTVLSIAGVAAYLGFLSRSINNGSQYEDSYSYSTAINRHLPSTSEETHLFHAPNGRSRSDFYPDDSIDYTNRLEDPPHQPTDSHPTVEDIDLNTKHINSIFYTQRNSSSILRNNFINTLPAPGPTGIPSPVTISSHKLNRPPPINLQSPLIIIGPKKNSSGNRYMESTLTAPITVHFDQNDGTGIIITKQQDPLIEQTQHHRKPIVVSGSAIEDSEEPGETTTSMNEKTIGTTILIGTVHEQDDKKTDPVRNNVNRQGVPISVSNPTLMSGTGSSKFGLISKLPAQEINSRPSLPSNNPFIPVNPYYKLTTTTEIPSPLNLLSNHRVHLTFDRISPEFYDEKPWTPLMIQPSQILDKRPRIEDIVSVSSSQPKLSEGSEKMYYAYGGTGGDNFKEKSQPPLPPSLVHVPPIGHLENNNSDMRLEDGFIPHELSTMDYSTGTNNFEEEINEDDSHALAHQYFKNENKHKHQQQIPTYTISIPHISHPTNFSNISHGDDVKTANDDVMEHRMETEGIELEEIGHEAEEMEEYERDEEEEEEEQNNKSQSEEKTRIYALDPTNTDMVPPPIEIEKENQQKAMFVIQKTPNVTTPFEVEEEPESIDQLEVEEPEIIDQLEIKKLKINTQSEIEEPGNKNLSEVQDPKIQDQSDLAEPNIKDQLELKKLRESMDKSEVEKEKNNSNAEHNSKHFQVKATTDLILSSLGSLHLMKTPSPGDISIEDRSQNNENPLFPPTRSYVSVNLPLRPKPTESESDETRDSAENIFIVSDPEKKLRLVNGDGFPLAPDLTSTSNINKVLSMMMTFDHSLPNQNLSGVMSLLKNNVELIVANHSLANSNQNFNNSYPPLSSVPIKTREHKSFTRDPKIDSRFRDSETQQVQVPLIPSNLTNSTTNQKTGFQNNENKTWVPTKLSSFTVNQHNSPVYKFILQKGQSVEDLLKEIFQNYTDKNIGKNETENTKGSEGVSHEDTLANVIHSESKVTGPSLVDIQLTTSQVQSTKIPSIVTTTIPDSTTPFTPLKTSTMDTGFRTSTSIVVNEVIQGTSMPNGTFRCTSTGVILSGFARCNSIKECADNSDEKNCKCVDYLKSQLLHRKICDGIVDCADETDESYCDWCSPGQYICSGSRACVSREKICDSRRDCPRGDDEANCVKIGPSEDVDHLEDISPIYHQSGYLMVRKKGLWGKLCVETFSSVLTHWEIKDLARAVCKAKTFSDFETVEKVIDDEERVNEPYYELYNGANDTASEEKLYSSDESSPRSVIGFKVSKCKTRMVVKVRCQELQCGTAPRAFTQAARYRGRRIVGGSNALPGEWPWQAALYRDGEYQCGATLISGRWLLSAGHCFYHAQDDYWVARLGTLRRGATILSPYEQVIKITHIFLHPQYKDIGFVNDVSLLRLEKEVKFTDFVRPVCLPGKETTIRDGRICTVVGWGQLFETGRVFPDTLQEVQLPLISTTECRKRTLFLPLYKLTDEMFCAGFDRGGRDACLGDSGGPLMCPESDGRWSLYGVTSNGYGCARANRPGVYTKTKSYLDWVYDKISQDSSFTYRDKAKPCPGHRCLLGECLEPRSVCNGIADCVDSSDERNCTWS